MSVGLVIVSHSSDIANGVVELARQMAPNVTIRAAGGTDDNGIGTSFDRVSAALESAESGTGVIVLCDLGSAVLTAETALDFLREDARTRVRIVDAPLVEGAVAAAVEANLGGDLDAVRRAAETAWIRGQSDGESQSLGVNQNLGDSQNDGSPLGETSSPVAAPTALPDSVPLPVPGAGQVTASIVLVNASGLHARPAAEFVKTAATFNALVTVNGTDAKSLLRIMSLGLSQGTAVELSAEGPDAAEAIAALVGLIRSGFGE